VDSATPGDCIRVEQLELFARVGVTESERANPQRLTVTIEIWPVTSFNDLHDDIGEAVDYSAVAAVARDFVTEQRCKLVETLVTRLADHLLKSFPLQRVQLELRKFVLPEADYVAVVVTRETAGNK